LPEAVEEETGERRRGGGQSDVSVGMSVVGLKPRRNV
jgi:hypothetical protein